MPDKEALKTFCADNNFKAWFNTSAKTGSNVEKAVNFLVAEILLSDKVNRELNANSGAATVKVGQPGHADSGECGC